MKPILLGMVNPHSDDPALALAPDPPGCAGWRLWKMLHDHRGVEKKEYLARFDRRNLLPGREWDAEAACVSGRGLVATLADSRRAIVVLGQEAWRALELGLKPKPASSRRVNGCKWIFLPHPSGRCHYYNDALNRWTVAALLTELMIKSRSEACAAS